MDRNPNSLQGDPVHKLSLVSRSWLMMAVVGLFAMLPASGAMPAQEKKAEAGPQRDIFDYEAQKAAKDFKRIVFIADTATHGPRGNHEFVAAAIYFARKINADYPNAY